VTSYIKKKVKDPLVRFENSLKIRQIFANDFPDSHFVSSDLAHGFLRVGQIQCELVALISSSN